MAGRTKDNGGLAEIRCCACEAGRVPVPLPKRHSRMKTRAVYDIDYHLFLRCPKNVEDCGAYQILRQMSHHSRVPRESNTRVNGKTTTILATKGPSAPGCGQRLIELNIRRDGTVALESIIMMRESAMEGPPNKETWDVPASRGMRCGSIPVQWNPRPSPPAASCLRRRNARGCQLRVCVRIFFVRQSMHSIALSTHLWLFAAEDISYALLGG